MKLTKKEFELLISAVKSYPQSVGMSGILMRAMFCKGDPDDEDGKKIQEKMKEQGELMEKDAAIILGKLYQLESEIVEQ